ncbi:MAG: formate dehydrogenase accessory protein FdhE [Chloroflexi bacterium]|nr:formate dehydrogenase accessory protein FdhE [Chloroflexota bacterium]
MIASYSRILSALDQARSAHPDLVDVIALHADLIQAQARAPIAFANAARALDGESAARALDRGEPLLTLLAWQPDAARVAELWTQVCFIIATHRADLAEAIACIAQLPAERLVSLVGAYLADEEIADAENNPEFPLARVALNHTLRPFLRAEAERWQSWLASAPWYLGSCPFCGGAPDFAALEKGDARRLLCSRCDTEWRFSRVGCPFCGDGADSYFEDAGYWLYVCDKCQRYLKAIDARYMEPPAILAAERVLTLGMDVAARDKGYVGV